MVEEDDKKGFAGIDSLVSEITKPTGKENKANRKIKNESRHSASQQSVAAGINTKRVNSATGYPGTEPLSSETESSSEKKKPSGNTGWAVFLVMIGIIGVIYWASQSSLTRVDDYRSLNKVPAQQSPRYPAEKTPNNLKAAPDTDGSPIALSGRLDPLGKQELCELQELLGELGYYKLTVDGLPGPGTRRAIAALFGEHPEVNNFEPTTRVLMYAQSQVARNASGAPTSANVTPPGSGQIMSRRSHGEAPFKISTSPGVNYYVKLVDSPGGSTAITFFVRGGQTEEVDVPYGNYSLRYASGSTWYGTTCLFGRNTSYFEADSTLRFYRSGAQIIGHRVELIRQLNGNMDAKTISAGRF